MVEVRVGDTVVRSSDPLAIKEEAAAFATVLSKNWLEGTNYEPLEIRANRKDGTSVRYIASMEPLN